METRKDDKKTQKLANEINLTGLKNHFSEKTLSGQKRQDMKDNVTEAFNKDNKKLSLQIDAVKGNNNAVLVLNNPQFVILLSEIRQTAGNVSQVFSSTENSAPWLPKEWRSEIVSDPYKNDDTKFRKMYDQKFNHFEEGKLAGSYLSITVTECFPNSLDRLASSTLSDDERINLTCDMGQQISNLFLDLEKKNYIWSDLKTSNIMLRSDNSIGVPDNKAFMSHEDILVKRLDSPYMKIVKRDTDLNEYENHILDGHFVYNVLDDADTPFEFRVKNINGEIIRGTISNEALRNKLGLSDDEAYKNFRATSNKIKPDDMNKIYELSKELYGTLTTAYTVSFENYTTEAFNSDEFRREKRHEDPHQAREKYIEDIKKEYSYQLAAVLYTTLTGDEMKFFMKPLDFSQTVFQSPEGQQLKSLVEGLSHENPNNRIPYQQALLKLNEIRSPIVRNLDAEPEIIAKSSSNRMIRRLSQKVVPNLRASDKKSGIINEPAKEHLTEQPVAVERRKSVSIQEQEPSRRNSEGPKRNMSEKEQLSRAQEGARFNSIQARAKIDRNKTPLATSESNTTTPTKKLTQG